MTRVEVYRRQLRVEDDWRKFLLRNSRLPGAAPNWALSAAVAEEGDRVLFGTLASANAKSAPDTPEEFLVVCGVVGLGRLVAEGDDTLLPTLRTFARSPSPNVQEAVDHALQRVAEQNVERILDIADDWTEGSYLEMRAAVATLAYRCVFLRGNHAEHALSILERVTASAVVANEQDPGLAQLRVALHDAWGVALKTERGRAYERARRYTKLNGSVAAWLGDMMHGAVSSASERDV